MQRPRAWFRGKLQNIQEGKEEAGTLTEAEVGKRRGCQTEKTGRCGLNQRKPRASASLPSFSVSKEP